MVSETELELDIVILSPDVNICEYTETEWDDLGTKNNVCIEGSRVIWG